MKINTLPNFSSSSALSSFSGVDELKPNAESHADQQAWQREMERAQMNGWLNNSLTGSARQAPDLSENSADDAGLGMMKQPPTSPFFSVAHSLLSVTPLSARESAPVAPALYTASAGGSEGSDVRMTGGNLQQRLMARIESLFSTETGWDGEASSHAMAVRAAASRTLQAEPLPVVDGRVSSPRISLELVGDDARLWLGISASDDLSETDLARIVSEARSMLAEDGVRLQEVMCNGKPLQTGLENIAVAGKKEASSFIGFSDGEAANGGVPFYSYFETRQET